jgi:UDP-N-acetyl-D-mannosaminuronic acid transferase (WecB/TagA/CpsF family)
MQFHTFFGIHFIKSSYKDCLREIETRLHKHKKTLIVTPNPEIIYDAHFDRELATILQSSDIAIPDGIGVFVGYQITDSRLPYSIKYLMLPLWCIRAILHSHSFTKQFGERITGSRLTPDILTLAAKNNIGVTIIDPVVTGNNPGDILKRASQEKIQKIVEARYP